MDLIGSLFNLLERDRVMEEMGRTLAERTVDRLDTPQLKISTTLVLDGWLPFETAVAHARYNCGKWVIVETYQTRAEAAAGHLRWVEKFADGNLPLALPCLYNSVFWTIEPETVLLSPAE